MTNEEAKRRLEVWLKCMDCPEDKQCYDSHLHSTCEYTDYCDETPVSEAVKVAIKALEQTTWIPVSERLPEAFRFVNCTCHSLIDDREDWVVETCYLPQLPDSPYSDWGNIPMLNMGDCEVVAWMYRDIPKPYKVEPQESEKALDTEGVLDKIKAEIESNMESIIGKYDSSIPKSNMPSYKIERNKVRKECISIIDKYR